LHEGGARLNVDADGDVVFALPGGTTVPNSPAAATPLPLAGAGEGADLSPVAGGSLDLDYVVWVLCHRADRILSRLPEGDRVVQAAA
jgi:hypothetical protein